MLEQHAEGGANRVAIEFAHAEPHECARPIEGLGDRGRFAESKLSNRTAEARRFCSQPGVEFGHLELDYLSLLRDPWKVDKQMQAWPPQRFRQLARAIRSQNHGRSVVGFQSSKLGHAHLEVGKQFEQ